MRREYVCNLFVNGRRFSRLVIDDHYKIRHAGSVNDDLILSVAKEVLDRQEFTPVDIDKNGFQYFVIDPAFSGGKAYRLVWLIPPGDADFIGVVNLFRRRHGRA